MGESFLPTKAPSASDGAKLQSFANVRDGNTVHSEGVVAVDETGEPIALALEQTQQDVLAAVRTLDSGAFSAPFTGTNGDAVTIAAAMPVAQPTTTLMRAANALGFALANVIGLVVVGADVTLPMRALAQGVLTLPASLWDAVTGDSGGLVPGARYYLGAAPGTLTTTPPSAPGSYLTLVGNAVSTITLLVDPQPPILL